LASARPDASSQLDCSSAALGHGGRSDAGPGRQRHTKAAYRWLPSWAQALFAQQLAHQPQRGLLVAAALHQYIEDLALVIDGAPQVHSLPGDPDDHLVKLPSIARARAAAPQLARDQRAELQDPAPHRLIGYRQAAPTQELLNIAVAQREAQIKPDRVLDDRRRKA